MHHDLTVTRPDYSGGSIVNLMRSVGDRCGADGSNYAPLEEIEERLKNASRVVLLVIDGLGSELLDAIGPDTVFARSRVRDITSVYPPTTATAITTFLSAQAPLQHGLTGWFMHFRRLGAVTAVLPFVPRYSHEPLSRAGVAIDTLVDCASFFDDIRCPAQTLMPAAINDSDFSRRLGGRAERIPYESLEDFAQTLGAICGGTPEAGFTYAYWSDFDRLCHMHGPSSEIVAQHLGELDEALGPVFEMCEENGTLLVAVADHGFIDSGPEERTDLAAHPALAELLTLPLCGEPRSAYCYVRAGCTDAFEQYVATELGDRAVAVPSRQLIEEGWFGLGRAHPEFAARVGDYTLQMRGRYTIGDQVAGERKIVMHGVHGGTSAAEMYVPLMLAGP